MTARIAAWTVAIACFCCMADPASAQDGPACGSAAPAATPIWLIVLASPGRVHAYAATVKNEAVLRQDATTVVFSSGRVVTSEVGAVGDHLTSLGWAERPIEIVASFPARGARRRSVG